MSASHADSDGQGASPAGEEVRRAQEGLTPRQLAAVLVLLTFCAYGPAFLAGFVWDDDDYVRMNYNLRTTAGLARTWREPRSIPQYYPLVHTSYWLEFQLWKLWPVGYHATNIVLHAASAVLLWRLLLLLDLPGAWLAAAVFALHPVQVESVAWITERKNTLSLLFYLAAAWCFLKRELVPGSRGSWRLYLLSLGWFLAALLCKTVTATLPCALLVVLWWKQGGLSARQFALVAPLLLLAVPLGMHTAWLERDHVGAVGPEFTFSFAERLLIAGRAVWFYASKLVFPYPLIFMYPRWEIDDQDWRQYLFPLTACLLVAVLWLLRRRIGRGPLAAALFFGGTLFPALGFFNVFPMKYSFVADHFQYAASIGLIVLLICGASAAASKLVPTWLSGLAAFALLVVLGTLTWQQCLIYRDQGTLWRDTLQKNPHCQMAYVNLGAFLREEGRFAETRELFETAIRLYPQDPDLHIGLAAAYVGLGKLDRAERILQDTIPLKPEYGLTYANLADVMQRQERFDDAARFYERALALDEKNDIVRYNYGVLLYKQRKLDAAQRQYERVLAESPDSVATRFNLAVIHWERGQWRQAADQFRAVLEIDPEYPDAPELLQEALANAQAGAPPPPPPVP